MQGSISNLEQYIKFSVLYVSGLLYVTKSQKNKKFFLTSVSNIITYIYYNNTRRLQSKTRLDTHAVVIWYKQIIWPLYPNLESPFSLAVVNNFSF